MPLNKSFQRRIEVLDACLRRKQRKWTIDSLLQEVNEKLEGLGAQRVSQRTLYADLNALKAEYAAPIETYRDGRIICYRYSNPEFSIRQLPLQQEEVGYLRDALHVLMQINGFQLTQELETVIGKLENTLATTAEKRHAIIQFEHTELTSGSSWLDDIFQAIKGRTVLHIRYQPFHKEAREYYYHPYLLKEYRNRWFVIGRKDGHHSLTTLALDRIQKLKASSRIFHENDLLNPDTYFDSLVGVTLPTDAEPEKIVLKVKQELAPYVLTKPIHASQKLIKTAANGDITLELCVVNNYELRSELLGLGPQLMVMEPQSLRKEMKAMYEQGMMAYESKSQQRQKSNA